MKVSSISDFGAHTLLPCLLFWSQGALDNLLKGAATQCMQNLNLALGYDELAGIPKDSL